MNTTPFIFLVLCIGFSATLISQEGTELVIGYIPETQKVLEPAPSTTERQAITALIKAAQTQGQQEPESTMSPFQDPVIV